MQRRAGDSLEFIENVKIDLFPDEVYVFTPKGKIVELPTGATAVDFAYAVHTDIGNACVACRINGRLASLSQPLLSGQKITIMTAQGAQPNPNWLNFAVSGKARSAIRHFLKSQRYSQSVALGRRLLSKAFQDLQMDFEQLDETQCQKLLAETKMQSIDALMEEVGLGNRVALSIAKLLKPDSDNKLRQNTTNSPISIDSAENMMISFARCCRPIPGDPIVAHISSGKGLVIHQESCRNINDTRNSPEKISQVNWAVNVSGEFLVDVRVEVESERGIIATLATRITEQGGSIEHINVQERDAHNSVINLCVGVQSRVHLANIMRRIRLLAFVIKIGRMKN
jgi:GTP diphosphokinase / guanosine-3',5'-bis(diphosphate) 3'-diphosphatase